MCSMARGAPGMAPSPHVVPASTTRRTLTGEVSPSVLRYCDEYDEMLKKYSGLALKDAKVFEIGFGTRAEIMIGLVSLGCAKNLVDSEVMLGTLAKEGMTLTNDAQEADVVIVGAGLAGLVAAHLGTERATITEFKVAFRRGVRRKASSEGWRAPTFEISAVRACPCPGRKYRPNAGPQGGEVRPRWTL